MSTPSRAQSVPKRNGTSPRMMARRGTNGQVKGYTNCLTSTLACTDNAKGAQANHCSADGPAYQVLAIAKGRERNRPDKPSVQNLPHSLWRRKSSFWLVPAPTTKSDARRLPVRRHRSPALTRLRRAPARRARPWPAAGLRHQEARRAAARPAAARTLVLAGTAPATRRS